MFLYILFNKEINKFYIGVTENIERRIIEHNSEQKHFTGKANGKWELVFFRRYLITSEAYKEEIRLKKSKNKKYLIWYINQYNEMGQ